MGWNKLSSFPELMLFDISLLTVLRYISKSIEIVTLPFLQWEPFWFNDPGKILILTTKVGLTNIEQ